MKLLVYSDLHLDLSHFKPQLDPDFLKTVDVVVLAGDTREGTEGLAWARKTFPDKPVIYVDGNHEFYSQHWDKHIDVMRKLAQDHGVHYLENDAVTIDGVRFLGCSLWTDYALHGADTKLAAMNEARQRMSDYTRIKITRPLEMYWQERKHRLFPAMAARRHDASRQWLEEQLDMGDPENTVVVTHHAPHPKSIPAEFEGHPLSPCYASDLEALMGKAGTWIHGHIHESLDYEVRGTRIVTNPRGYRLRGGRMDNSEFRVDFCVDVGRAGPLTDTTQGSP